MNLAEAAIVAVGSNLGNPFQVVTGAMERLHQLSCAPMLASSLWETQPVDCPPDTPPFVNAVVALQPVPLETAETLLRKLQVIERQFGRQRTGTRNEARTLDLDLIAFGSQVITTTDLTLPHPRAHLRAFVLSPLSELTESYRLPLQSKTVKQLLEELTVPAGALRRIKASGGQDLD